MSKYPWTKDRVNLTRYDWSIAVGFHPDHRNTSRDVRVAQAVAYFLFKDTNFAWPTQETIRQMAHLADRSQVHRALRALEKSGAFKVRPLRELPASIRSQVEIKRDSRSVCYEISLDWAFATIRDQYEKHDAVPEHLCKRKPTHPQEQSYDASPATYSDPRYDAGPATNYDAGPASLNIKVTPRAEETPSCGPAPYACAVSAEASTASIHRLRDISHPGGPIISDNVDPRDVDLSIEEQIDIDEYRLNDAVYIEDWLSRYNPDNETYRRIVRLAERGELEMHHLKEVA